jgi:hypothetical protein
MSSNNIIVPEETSAVIDINYPGILYNISTPGNLLWVLTNNFNISTSSSITSEIKYFRLINNIDMRNQKIPTANLNNFILDSDSKTISNFVCDTTLFNEIDNLSIISNITFNNYQCDALIGNNKGSVINCKFNNANCISSALTITNSNLIINCKFNNIKLTSNILNAQCGVVANNLSSDLSTIDTCKIHNIEFFGNGFFGGIVGNLLIGSILNSTVSNINHNNISGQNYTIGGICGIISSSISSIETCNVDINLDTNTSIICGKIINGTVNIKCLTFKTNKGDTEDNKPVDLKYDRISENKKREDVKKAQEASLEAANRALEASQEAAQDALKRAREEAQRMQDIFRPQVSVNTETFYNKMPNIFKLFPRDLFTNAAPETTSSNNIYKLFINILEGVNVINMNNIFKFTSGHKMSKLDYSYITYDGIPCGLELPKVPLAKPIDTSKIDTIKNDIANNIKQTSLLDVDVSSYVDGTTLYITITDKQPTPMLPPTINTETTTVPEITTTIPTTVPEITTTIPTTVPETTTTLPTTVPEITTTLPITVPEITTTLPTTVPEITTTLPTTVPEITTTLPITVPEITTTMPEITTTMLQSSIAPETFESSITDTVYILDTSNNTAIMDSLNQTTTDISLLTTTSSLSITSSSSTTPSSSTTTPSSSTTTPSSSSTTPSSSSTTPSSSTTTPSSSSTTPSSSSTTPSSSSITPSSSSITPSSSSTTPSSSSITTTSQLNKPEVHQKSSKLFEGLLRLAIIIVILIAIIYFLKIKFITN